MTFREDQMIKIVKHERPPNYEKILAVFPMASKPSVVFAYGYKIYVPGGGDLTPPLLAHETVHCDRQVRMGVEAWWDKYLEDVNFRFFEELLAHRAEIDRMVAGGSRHVRRRAEAEVAKKLSARLYGPMCSRDQAIKALRAGP